MHVLHAFYSCFSIKLCARLQKKTIFFPQQPLVILFFMLFCTYTYANCSYVLDV